MNSHKPNIKLFLISFLLLINPPAYPESTHQNASHSKKIMIQEISFLLSEIKKTSCKLKRNGTLHTGPEAEKHIRRKYRYARNKIKSAEHFIRYVASRSSWTGRPYTLICANINTQETKHWLLSRLSAHRKQHTNKQLK
ncbi:hypothetical protein MNBD_GAMMA12-395 [hydrothermal vent metagenome]|uniref:Uncharacterized protein n=1 Tax=hydrothermal vent metagenome TaxID=652676 RepID=A0A3B0YE05_9ZZZZ